MHRVNEVRPIFKRPSQAAERGFVWDGFCDATASELLSGSCSVTTKTKQAEQLLIDAMRDGPCLSEEYYSGIKIPE